MRVAQELPVSDVGTVRKEALGSGTAQPSFVAGHWRFLWATANRKRAGKEIKSMIMLQKARATSWKVQ